MARARPSKPSEPKQERSQRIAPKTVEPVRSLVPQVVRLKQRLQVWNRRHLTHMPFRQLCGRTQAAPCPSAAGKCQLPPTTEQMKKKLWGKQQRPQHPVAFAAYACPEASRLGSEGGTSTHRAGLLLFSLLLRRCWPISCAASTRSEVMCSGPSALSGCDD